MPTKPAGARNVKDFGVRGDGSDETVALQRALDSLQPGQWLVFPAGKYVHNKSLQVKVPGTVLWSEGATLHATNPEDQAIWLKADGASIYNFTLTAVTDRRLTAPWNSRIAVFGGSRPKVLLRNNVIRGNKVIHAGAPGTPLANASSSAGIFVYHATRFLVAENTVSRSLADAIHMTAGSHDGRVLRNVVREPGDDMVAMVSYLGSPTKLASTVAAEYEAKRSTDLVRNVLVANNDVSGNYWGRGITVVGGENITIQSNKINKTTHAAGIYLARETSYLTFGVRNVLVRDNNITQVQTTPPAYYPSWKTNIGTTGHGGVEIYSWLFTDENNISSLRDRLAVQNIQIENNTIHDVKSNTFRIGNGWGRTWGYTVRRDDGTSFVRNITGGKVGLVNLHNNTMSQAGSTPISIRNQPTETYNIRCNGNTYDGQPNSASQCSGPAPVVVGAQVTCS